MKLRHLLAPTLAAAALASCDNPADSTTTATVKEAEATRGDPEEDPEFALSDDSTVNFVGSKVTGSHNGGFHHLDGHIHINDQDEVTGGTITIDMDSTWADDEKLTGHLKSADFFDIETYPQSTFILTTVSKSGEGAYQISGNLEMRGVTKNVTFPATATKDGHDIKVQAEFDINRKLWGIEYPGKKDDLIRDEVILKLDLVITPHGEHGHTH